jgi:hypothetical protein
VLGPMDGNRVGRELASAVPRRGFGRTAGLPLSETRAGSKTFFPERSGPSESGRQDPSPEVSSPQGFCPGGTDSATPGGLTACPTAWASGWWTDRGACLTACLTACLAAWVSELWARPTGPAGSSDLSGSRRAIVEVVETGLPPWTAVGRAGSMGYRVPLCWDGVVGCRVVLLSHPRRRPLSPAVRSGGMRCPLDRARPCDEGLLPSQRPRPPPASLGPEDGLGCLCLVTPSWRRLTASRTVVASAMDRRRGWRIDQLPWPASGHRRHQNDRLSDADGRCARGDARWRSLWLWGHVRARLKGYGRAELGGRGFEPRQSVCFRPVSTVTGESRWGGPDRRRPVSDPVQRCTR